MRCVDRHIHSATDSRFDRIVIYYVWLNASWRAHSILLLTILSNTISNVNECCVLRVTKRKSLCKLHNPIIKIVNVLVDLSAHWNISSEPTNRHLNARQNNWRRKKMWTGKHSNYKINVIWVRLWMLWRRLIANRMTDGRTDTQVRSRCTMAAAEAVWGVIRFCAAFFRDTFFFCCFSLQLLLCGVLQRGARCSVLFQHCIWTGKHAHKWK